VGRTPSHQKQTLLSASATETAAVVATLGWLTGRQPSRRCMWLQLKSPSNFHRPKKILAETEMQTFIDKAEIGGNNWFYSKA
jgi:hypothetical protein